MTGKIGEKIKRELNLIRELINNSLYNDKNVSIIDEAVLTELIMISAYLVQLYKKLCTGKEISEKESRHANEIFLRIKELQKSLQ